MANETESLPELYGWGRWPRVRAPELASEDLRTIGSRATLTRGLGRSYGDASLPANGAPVACSRFADRILSFDEQSGWMRAEAGLSLAQLYTLFLHRGWFVPVTPGTKFVTLGGAVAADVHGKNHHVAGCFGAHVRQLLLQVADGRLVECSPEVESELFFATLGGMGLTGHILEVEFRMTRIPSPWIWSETKRVRDFDELWRTLKEGSRSWPFTMSFVDSLSSGRKLGRAMISMGRWAESGEAPPTPPKSPRPFTLPVDLPGFLMARPNMRIFNGLMFSLPLPAGPRVLATDTYWYPLDSFLEWNRLYGRRGFTQHQCVIPDEAGPDAARRVFEVITRQGGAVCLCVIKDCGAEGQGLLSFPKPGISIALDIPMREGTQRLVDAINEQVIKEGGRIYLAKDALTRREHFEAMEGPRLASFARVRDRWDPTRRLRSAQSVRLLGDEA